MIHFTKRTRRGLAEAILLPGTLGSLAGLLLLLTRWLGAPS
jgi:hypothetical protein